MIIMPYILIVLLVCLVSFSINLVNSITTVSNETASFHIPMCTDSILVIGVSTNSFDSRSRKAYRETWGSVSEQQKFNFKVVYFHFSLGIHDTIANNESRIYHDVVSLQHGSGLPHDLSMLLWMTKNCEKSMYFLTIGLTFYDNMYIHVPNLLKAIEYNADIYMYDSTYETNNVHFMSSKMAILIKSEINDFQSKDSTISFLKRLEKRYNIIPDTVNGLYLTRVDHVEHNGLCKCALLQSYTSHTHVYSMWLYNQCEFEKSEYPCVDFLKYEENILLFISCVVLALFLTKLFSLKKQKTTVTDKNRTDSELPLLQDHPELPSTSGEESDG